MAELRKIVIQNFRNIVLQEIEFSPNVNCITGGNGEGKTNLLDAVYYLSMTKSAFSASDSFNYRHSEQSFALSGLYLMPNGTESRFSVQAQKGLQKIIKRDEKVYTRISDHIGVLPVVLVSPSDISLVSESGEERRKFVNSVLSQMDREYLNVIQNYNKLLLQRNMMLKAGTQDDTLFDTVEEMMSAAADRIYSRRKEFADNIAPSVAQWYERLSGGRETIGIGYRSDLSDTSLSELLKSSRNKDRMLGFTSGGVHRDDFVFTMDGYPIRKCGSQGQQKSFVVALKLAQYSIMTSRCGVRPLLLMDDLFDKLDLNRVQNLLGIVSGEDFGQIFITDSNKVRISSIIESISGDRAIIDTHDGCYTRTDGQQ